MLTKKQSTILSLIKKIYSDHGYIPSVRDIAKQLDYSSPATIWEHLQNLIRKGYLKKENDMLMLADSDHSNVQPVEWNSAKALELPILGSIVAGSPLESYENPGETFAVPSSLVKDPNSYVLKVRGESMIDDGILDGDYVIVERNFYPHNGDVVVALIDNAALTLKKFFREKRWIRLQPANASMKPILSKNVVIQGIVRAIVRQYAR